MKRHLGLEEIYRQQPPAVQSAIDELEMRGLRWGIHFGTENATEIRAEMDCVFEEGVLYKWLAERLGVETA